MNRADYLDQRRADRECADSRAERGLPHHPDGSGLALCPRCNGNGEQDNGHWHPEMASADICTLCDGSGYITDGYRDPLLRLRYARQSHVRRRDPRQYMHLLKLCTYPCWPLRLIEACVALQITTQRSVQAWRNVA